MMTRTLALASATLLLFSGCASLHPTASDEAPPPANPDFASAMARFNAQFPNEQASRYEEVSINYNNNLKLDERGNCHQRSKYPVVIVLTLDASGKVIGSTTDVMNAKAECFRQAYAAVQLPPPPFAPYQKPIRLR